MHKTIPEVFTCNGVWGGCRIETSKILLTTGTVKKKNIHLQNVYSSIECHTGVKNEGNVFISVLVTQLCSTLCDPTDCSPPGSSVDGIPQTRILEWAAISSSNVNFSSSSLDAKSCPTLVTPQTVACQVLLSMGFYRQEYWSGWAAISFSNVFIQRMSETAG